LVIGVRGLRVVYVSIYIIMSMGLLFSLDVRGGLPQAWYSSHSIHEGAVGDDDVDDFTNP
jgi:hypothetical protein